MHKTVLLIVAAALLTPLALAQPGNPAIDSELRLMKARALPLDSVRLTGGPLKHAQDHLVGKEGTDTVEALDRFIAVHPGDAGAFVKRAKLAIRSRCQSDGKIGFYFESLSSRRP